MSEPDGNGTLDSRSSLARALEGSDLGAWDWRVGADELTVNQRWREIVGVPGEDLRYGREAWIGAIHPDDVASMRAAAAALVAGASDRYDEEYRLRLPDGRWRWVRSRARAVERGPDGRALRLAGTLDDVTERREAQEQLRASEQFYQDIFERNRAPKLLIDPGSGRIVEANQAACQLYGYAHPQLTALHIWDLNLLGEEETRRRLAMARDSSQTEFLFRHRLASGEIRDVQVFSGPVRAGGRTLLHSIVIDVTEQVRAQAQLRAGVERQRAILATSLDGFLLIDRGGTIREVNEAYCRMTGHEAAELVGRHASEVDALDSAADVAARLARLEALGRDRFESRHRRKDGSPLDVQVSAQRVPGETGLVAAFIQDISERKRAERELAERERRYRQLFEQVPSGVWEEDLSGVKTRLEALRAAGVQDLAAHLASHPAEAAEILAEVRVLDVNDRACRMASARDRPELLANLHRVFLPEMLEAFVRELTQLEEAGAFLVEGWNGTLAGDRRWVVAQGVVAPGREADWGRVLVTTADITEWRAAREEKARLEERLNRSEKLEAIGRLAGGVAHDFNNLLSVVLTCAAALREELRAGRPVRESDLEEIQLAGERASELTRQLLAFARRQVVAPVVLDLNQVVRGTERLLARALGEAILLDFRAAPGPLGVVADRGQLEQVIVNLALNARDAMPGGGRLTIETERATTSEEPGGHPGGSWVRLRVQDEGRGLPPEVLPHIFEPFFTTKEVGKGTGLGLATVHGIVGQAGGHVHVESAPGKGTTFVICLPEAGGVPAPAPAPVEPEPAAGASAGETILVVEDEPLVRQVATRTLAAVGYRVLAAGSGPEALALAGDLAPGTLRLVLSDVIMPGGDGRSVVEELRRRHGPVPALFVSGYPQEVLGQGVLDPSVELLAKPFTGEQLRARVRALLDQQ